MGFVLILLQKDKDSIPCTLPDHGHDATYLFFFSFFIFLSSLRLFCGMNLWFSRAIFMLELAKINRNIQRNIKLVCILPHLAPPPKIKKLTNEDSPSRDLLVLRPCLSRPNLSFIMITTQSLEGEGFRKYVDFKSTSVLIPSSSSFLPRIRYGVNSGRNPGENLEKEPTGYPLSRV